MSRHPRLIGTLGLGVGMVAVLWVSFSGPFPLSEFCSRNRPTWVLPLFERPRYTAVTSETFLLTLFALTVTYLGALRLVGGVRGPFAGPLLLGALPLAFLLVLAPGYPLLSNDIFKYVFDGRILAVYGQNPFVHVPAEFPQDRFYDLVYWRAVVNAHGPIWRVLEAASAALAGESCSGAILAMKVWPSLAYLGTIGTLYAILRACRPERAVSGTLLYAWNPLVLLESLQNGHNDVVGALPALAATWLAFRGRIIWVFPLLTISLLVKPLALALGPLLLLVAIRRPRQAALSLIVGALMAFVGYLPFWAGPVTLQGLSRERIFSASPAELLLLTLQSAGVSPEHAMVVAAVTASGLFSLAVVLLLRVTWLGRLSVLSAAVGVFYLYLLVGAQWFNPWYVLWIAPLAALVPDRPPRALGVAFTLVAPLVYPLQYEAGPIVAIVFLPMAILALWWRWWLGWSIGRDPIAATAEPRLQMAKS